MPLDSHDYLVNQGWSGKGTGLRHGAISRPLAIPQKKNLAGLGKDRDEAFPFWDHLFSAAANSIKLKCLSDGEEDESEQSSNNVEIKRTSTGILSTRRPPEGTPATSGSSTPNPDSDPQIPRLSLLATAKRDAAKQGLYSRFFRGPIIGPETLAEEEKRLASLVSAAFAHKDPDVERVTVKEHIEIKTCDESVMVDLEVSQSSKSLKRKRKSRDEEVTAEVERDKEAKRDRKRRKNIEKRREEEDRASSKKDGRGKKKKKRENQKDASLSTPPPEDVSASRKPNNFRDARVQEAAEARSLAPESEEKSERKRRKGERKRLKEEKRRLKANLNEVAEVTYSQDRSYSIVPTPTLTDASSQKQAKYSEAMDELIENGGKKKKRKAS
ncbi:hypothetical protein NLJ89_g7762 [Agrocybe chaxingu]|uniref:G-patch domain-containing protein n=1 Tax=Agrocybe chaxingu TaxID=84603 RepID=A0A9W8MUR4_9AGAR|nr:hypothetical protein NLJ89_g7762 [Agrocybe chaxingu]